jgi:hypothetical protein
MLAVLSSQQFTVFECPSGSTTVTLVTRGELLGAKDGSWLMVGLAVGEIEKLGEFEPEQTTESSNSP